MRPKTAPEAFIGLLLDSACVSSNSWKEFIQFGATLMAREQGLPTVDASRITSLATGARRLAASAIPTYSPVDTETLAFALEQWGL